MQQVPTIDIDQVFARTAKLTSLNSKVLACSNDYFGSTNKFLTPTPLSRASIWSLTPMLSTIAQRHAAINRSHMTGLRSSQA
ncbi:hypothetical protein N7467_007393 [Penicillium canescens]|nr:hypothetical protein N7467_007393 [Penicillium canescens]